MGERELREKLAAAEAERDRLRAVVEAEHDRLDRLASRAWNAMIQATGGYGAVGADEHEWKRQWLRENAR